MMQEDGCQPQTTQLPYILDAYMQTGDETSAKEIIKNTDKGELETAMAILAEKAETDEEKQWVSGLQTQVKQFA